MASQHVTWLNIRSSDYLLTSHTKNAESSRGVPPRGSLRGMCARLLFAADAKFLAAGIMPCVQQRGGKITACRNMSTYYITYFSPVNPNFDTGWCLYHPAVASKTIRENISGLTIQFFAQAFTGALSPHTTTSEQRKRKSWTC